MLSDAAIQALTVMVTGIALAYFAYLGQRLKAKVTSIEAKTDQVVAATVPTALAQSVDGMARTARLRTVAVTLRRLAAASANPEDARAATVAEELFQEAADGP